MEAIKVFHHGGGRSIHVVGTGEEQSYRRWQDKEFLLMVSGYTNSQKLSWMNNNLVFIVELEFDPVTQEISATACEWK